MPAKVTAIEDAMLFVRKGLSASRNRQQTIELSIAGAGRSLDAATITRVGGLKLLRAREAVLAAEAALNAHQDSRAAALVKWRWIPFYGALTSSSVRSVEHSLETALQKRSRILEDLELRIRAILSKKRVAAASASHAEELGHLRYAIDWSETLLAQLEQLRSQGVTSLGLEPPSTNGSRGWIRRLDLLLRAEPADEGKANTVTVINDGGDHSSLDLRWRSKPAPMLRTGLTLADQAWLNGVRDDRSCLLPQNKLPGSLAGYRLEGRAPVVAPQHLFRPRERRAVPLLSGGYNRMDRIYLPAPIERIDEIAAAGGSIGKRGGFQIDPSKVDCGGPITAFLPFIAQRWYAPLPVEIIPSSSWGSSLANLLTPSSWGEIRKGVTAKYGGLCQVCGQLKGDGSIECHEIWDYQIDHKVDGMRIQRLAGLYSVCKPCHGVFHLGFSRMRGHEDSASYRLADINGWSMAELEEAEEWMWANYEQRSRCRWALDLSLVGSGRPLIVDKSKWERTESGDLQPVVPGERRSTTRIYGASFRMGAKGVVYAASQASQLAA